MITTRQRSWELVRRLPRLSLKAIPRAYAIAVIAVTAWLSYLALRYLIVTLMFPTAVPARIVGIPTRFDRTVLQEPSSYWPGLQTEENPRMAPAHYHRVEGWMRPDRFNDCTRSGCHAPLPHSKRKEVRAFLNMHATSLHCGVCHIKTDAEPLSLTWYDLDRGKPCGRPAILNAYDFVTSAEGRKRLADPTADDQAHLVDLLGEAAREADGEPALETLVKHVATVRPGSEAFQRLMEAVRTALPRHFRGEYGAKLALRDPGSGRPVLAHPDTSEAVREYLQRGAASAGADRDALLARVHPFKREQPLHCTNCHRPKDSLIAFESVGYPPARQEALTGPPVFQMIEHISAGLPMNLPGFFNSPTSQPDVPSSQDSANHN